ncbi:hypothetical protein Tco_0386247 [Tanacetum coccineum]
MVEPEKPIKKKELIRLDEEIASKLQAEFDEEARLAREKMLIIKWLNKCKQKNKRMEGNEVRAEAEISQESSSKRVGTELEQESIKKQKADKETIELQRLIEVVLDKEEVAIDAIPLATKPPSIVDYKIYKEGKKTYYQIIMADGSSKISAWDTPRAIEGCSESAPVRSKYKVDPQVQYQAWQESTVITSKDWSSYRVIQGKNNHRERKNVPPFKMLVNKEKSPYTCNITYMLNRKASKLSLDRMCYQLLSSSPNNSESLK